VKLQDRVHRSQIRDVNQLKSRLVEEWEHFHQVVIDEAARQWRPHLRACVRAHGGHFDLIGLSSVLRRRQHSIGYMGDGFYRSKDPTNSIKVLKVHILHRQIKHTIIKQ